VEGLTEFVGDILAVVEELAAGRAPDQHSLPEEISPHAAENETL
jgi:hypothetical protein